MSSIILIFSFVLGVCIGSFLNVVIVRLPAERSIVGFSACPQCGTRIRWYDNIPLLSFLLLRGRCRACGGSISFQYPLIELATGLLFGGSALSLGASSFSTWQEWVYLVMVWLVLAVCVVVTVYDIRYYLVPDAVVIPSVVVVGLLGLVAMTVSVWMTTVVAGALTYVGILGGVVLVTRGKGMGMGDVKLGALLGMLLGFPQSFYAILLSFWVGAFVGIALIVTKKKTRKDLLPFAPFLIGAAIVVWFAREVIENLPREFLLPF